MGGDNGIVVSLNNSYDIVRRVTERAEDEQDYNHSCISANIGIEVPRYSYLSVFLGGSHQSADAGESGALRRNIEVGFGFKTKPFLNLFSIRPVITMGVGGGTYFSQAGLDPVPLDPGELDMSGKLDLQFLMGYDWPSGLGFELGAATHLRASTVGYYEHGFGARFGLRFTPYKPIEVDPCYANLSDSLWRYNQEVQKLFTPHSKAVKQYSENQAYEKVIRRLIKDRKRIHEEVKAYCPKKVPDVKRRDITFSIPSLPQLKNYETCSSRMSEVILKREGISSLGKKYEDLNEKLEDRRKVLRDKLSDLLNWPPLDCLPFPYPPRYILYANDNPDLPLQPQWRPSVEQGALTLFSNPHLDEVMAYLDRSDKQDLKVRFIAIANDTSDVEDDPKRDKRLAQERAAGVHQYVTLKGLKSKECKEFKVKGKKDSIEEIVKGLACKYQYRNTSFRSRKDSKVFYEETAQTKTNGVRESKDKRIGGAIIHHKERSKEETGDNLIKVVVLPENRVCKPEAYAASELFNKDGLLPEVKELFPTWTWTLSPTSPIFRTVLIEIVEKCPDEGLIKGAAQAVQPEVENSK